MFKRKDSFALSFSVMHLVIVSVLSCISLLTQNSEAPPIAFVPIVYIDFPAFVLGHFFLSIDSAVVVMFLFPVIAGTAQWYLIGFFLDKVVAYRKGDLNKRLMDDETKPKKVLRK